MGRLLYDENLRTRYSFIFLFYVFSTRSHKPDRSDDIHGWRGNRGHDPLPVRGHSEVYHQKRAADGENSLGVHTQRIPGKRSRAFFARVNARILSRPETARRRRVHWRSLYNDNNVNNYQHDGFAP